MGYFRKHQSSKFIFVKVIMKIPQIKLYLLIVICSFNKDKLLLADLQNLLATKVKMLHVDLNDLKAPDSYTVPENANLTMNTRSF